MSGAAAKNPTNIIFTITKLYCFRNLLTNQLTINIWMKCIKQTAFNWVSRLKVWSLGNCNYDTLLWAVPLSKIAQLQLPRHSDICLLTAYQNKYLLTGAKWNKNKQTNGLSPLRTDFLAWLRFVVLTCRALCNAGRVDTIHVLHTTLYTKTHVF